MKAADSQTVTRAVEKVKANEAKLLAMLGMP
jgi:hypothetical protein